MNSRWKTIGFMPYGGVDTYVQDAATRFRGLSKYDLRKSGARCRSSDLVFSSRLIAAKHFNLPDAVEVDGYVREAFSIAEDLLEGSWFDDDAFADPSLPRSGQIDWFVAAQCGIMAAFLLNNDEQIVSLCSKFRDDFERSYNGPFETDMDIFYVALAKVAVEKLMPGAPIVNLDSLVGHLKSRSAKSSVAILKAIADGAQSDYSSAVKRGLQQHDRHCKKLISDEYAGNNIEDFLARPLSSMCMLGSKLNLTLPQLDERLSAYLICPATISG